MVERLYVSELSKTESYITELKDALRIFNWQLCDDTYIPTDNFYNSTYVIVTYDDYQNMPGIRDMILGINQRRYVLFKSDEQFSDALKQINISKAKWSRFSEKDSGYEVTSKGDRRFSPFFMKLVNNHRIFTLEQYYHLFCKGYWYVGKRNYKELKGLPPLTENFSDLVHNMYRRYLYQHKGLLFELIHITNYYVLTDMFDVNGGQNKVYCELINSLSKNIKLN